MKTGYAGRQRPDRHHTLFQAEGGNMAVIAVIIDDMFEDSEYNEPVQAFRENGHRFR
jgi:putative intracellular protease/amidase